MATLAIRVAVVANARRWGGGLHRAHLARLVGADLYSKEFERALMIAYRQHKIDFCGQYVVATVNRERTAA